MSITIIFAYENGGGRRPSRIGQNPGESVRALKPYTAFVEVATKIAAYNYYLDVGDAAIKTLRYNSTAERLEF